MSKAVMISIQPKWCELIASGKKTIEVRKTAPKIDTPFKCYIYCTASDVHSCLMVGDGEAKLVHCCNYKTAIPVGGDIGNGKVIGEFVCDRIETIACHKSYNGVGFDYTYYTESKDTLTNETQLTDYEMQQYLGSAGDGGCVGYAWHISDLKIYDTPKELGEFSVHCKEWDKVDHLPEELECRCCRYCQKEYDDYEPVIAVYNPICYGSKPLTRPPQSWCYVEED